MTISDVINPNSKYYSKYMCDILGRDMLRLRACVRYNVLGHPAIDPEGPFGDFVNRLIGDVSEDIKWVDKDNDLFEANDKIIYLNKVPGSDMFVIAMVFSHEEFYFEVYRHDQDKFIKANMHIVKDYKNTGFDDVDWNVGIIDDDGSTLGWRMGYNNPGFSPDLVASVISHLIHRAGARGWWGKAKEWWVRAKWKIKGWI